VVDTALCGSPYPTPYSIATSATTLNTVLTSWSGSACDGTIVFSSSGASLTLPQTYTFSSRLILDASGLGSSVTLLAASSTRHFTFSGSAANLTATNIIFANGAVTSAASANGGSVQLLSSASGLFTSCTFSGNSLKSTGADAYGGAIYAYASGRLMLRGCTLSGNTISASTGCAGGAIYVSSASSALIIIRSRFIRNRAKVRIPCLCTSSPPSA
jgi:hypothetical protein